MSDITITPDGVSHLVESAVVGIALFLARYAFKQIADGQEEIRKTVEKHEPRIAVLENRADNTEHRLNHVEAARGSRR